MSSRGGYRRRDRSWEKDDRDRDRYSGRSGRSYRDEKRRSSRSRSPRRDKDRDHKERRDRDYDYKRDDDKRRDRDRDREAPRRDGRGAPREDKYMEAKDRTGSRAEPGPSARPEQSKGTAHPSVDPNTPEYAEDGEAMDDANDEEMALMASMGLCGFGTTKGKHVVGNQEGSANVKKMRTWRQYMNRRGGFNRPLDKIK